MTTKTNDRPSTRDRLEDLGISYEELCEVMATWGNPPPVNVDMSTMTIDALWHSKEEAYRHEKEWATHKGSIVLELKRRVEAAHPKFKPEDGGSVEIVGENIRLVMTFDRDYEINEELLGELRALSYEEGAAINADEFDEMVSYDPKVNGTKFNKYLRRGGDLADKLGRLRTLQSARPQFEAKSR